MSSTSTATMTLNKLVSSPRTDPAIRVVPNSRLYVSEPSPYMFGNPPNPSDDPAWTNPNWLQSRFHFSFAEYENYHNSHFGSLRVMNDDLVQPHRMFGAHPHREMEIITYVVDGSLTHKDNMGTEETLGRGSIQFMTAGTGVVHSEANHGEKPLRFIQTWIVPSRRGLKPNYGSYSGATDAELRKNQLQHLVSNVADDSVATPVAIHQDVDGFASELELGQMVKHDLPPGRQAYMLCIEGSVRVNGKVLKRHDACEITGSGTIEIEAIGVEDIGQGPVAHILMYAMKEERGSGRTDL